LKAEWSDKVAVNYENKEIKAPILLKYPYAGLKSSKNQGNTIYWQN
jgi:hypothetical protein